MNKVLPPRIIPSSSDRSFGRANISSHRRLSSGGGGDVNAARGPCVRVQGTETIVGTKGKRKDERRRVHSETRENEARASSRWQRGRQKDESVRRRTEAGGKVGNLALPLHKDKRGGAGRRSEKREQRNGSNEYQRERMEEECREKQRAPPRLVFCAFQASLSLASTCFSSASRSSSFSPSRRVSFLA